MADLNTVLDTTKHYAPVSLGRVLVLGLGKSGKAAATFCASVLDSRVKSLTVYGGASNDEARAFADGLPGQVRVVFDSEDVQGEYDLCIASPGISEHSTFYKNAKAHSAGVISEVEFAWRESCATSKWVAITGTNGKTTTTSLIAHILQTCGIVARAVGNIGDTCLEHVLRGDTDVYVAEVSSYQLASTVRFKPEVAVMLNITPDHLAWHGSFEAYAQAKRKIYANCGAGDVVVMDATNDVVRSFVRELRACKSRTFDYIPMGTGDGLSGNMIQACGADNACYLDAQEKLCVDFRGVHHVLVAASDLLIKGEHNASNALASAAAAVALGCDDEGIRKGLTTFEPLEHRIEPCGTIAGIYCYNDSKATNVDATLKALAAFGEEKPIVLLGGHDKGTPLEDLVSAAEKHCKAVVCFGEAGARFLEAFKDANLAVYSAHHLEDALDEALLHAQAGDIVMLSPACSSFDEFSCFEERGDVFKKLVEARRQKRGA